MDEYITAISTRYCLHITIWRRFLTDSELLLNIIPIDDMHLYTEKPETQDWVMTLLHSHFSPELFAMCMSGTKFSLIKRAGRIYYLYNWKALKIDLIFETESGDITSAIMGKKLQVVKNSMFDGIEYKISDDSGDQCVAFGSNVDISDEIYKKSRGASLIATRLWPRI